MEVIKVKIGEAICDCDGMPLYVVADIGGGIVSLVQRNHPEDRIDNLYAKARAVQVDARCKRRQNILQREKRIDRREIGD